MHSIGRINIVDLEDSTNPLITSVDILSTSGSSKYTAIFVSMGDLTVNLRP